MRKPNRLIYCSRPDGRVTVLSGDRKIAWDRPVRYVPAGAAELLLREPHFFAAFTVEELEERWGVSPTGEMHRLSVSPSDNGDALDVIVLDEPTEALLLVAARSPTESASLSGMTKAELSQVHEQILGEAPPASFTKDDIRSAIDAATAAGGDA